MAASLAGKRVTVMGLGRFSGGVSVTRWLVRQGAIVTVTDLSDEDALAESVDSLKDLPLTLHLGGHRTPDFTQVDLIVVNPAVPKTAPQLQMAAEAGVALTAEMNLFFERCPAPIIGVTGTTGKSTTAAMINHILQSSCTDRKIWLGGNIGQSLVEQLDQIQAEDLVVLELSSFQLEDLGDIKRSPHVAVVTNLSANHLDRHGSYESYIRAKQNILRYQSKDDFAVLNATQKELHDWARQCHSRCVFFEEPGSPVTLRIPGRFNQLNASAALATSRLFCRVVQKSLESFNGLSHRLEYVGTIEGVQFYNDSKATTPESVIVALASFNEPCIVIVGGYDKNIALQPMIRALCERAKGVVCMGQTAGRFLEGIQQHRVTLGLPKVKAVRDLMGAFRMAAHWSRSGDVVLLSPGCASYDQFTSFEQRGDQFRQLVQQHVR